MDCFSASPFSPFKIWAWRTAFFVASCSFTLGKAESLSSSSASCSATPLSVSIRNVTVANQPSNAIARGLAINVGSPPQEFAFLPHFFNNSFVYSDSNLCSNGTQGNPSTQNACITIRGGAYNAFASTTQKRGESDQTASDASPYPSTSIYSDVFVLNDQVELPDYTFGVPLADWGEQFYTPQAVLGLGRNSTFLNRLKSQGLIPSRTWSFYWGMAGRDQQSNGSMVFGGYDKSKVQGQNYTFKLNYTECKWGTTVEISELGLEFLDGKSVSLMEDTGIESDEVALPLYGCLSPDVIGVFDMPYNNYFARFADITDYESFYYHDYGDGTIRSHDYNYWDLTYPAGDTGAFYGDFNVSIMHGPSVRISNKQIVVPHVYMDADNGIWQQDGSSYDLLISSIGQDDDFSRIMMGLNRAFMTSVYLMVNLDAGEFTIWAAYTDSDSEDLVAVDEKNHVIQDVAACANTASSRPSPAPAPTLSNGAIAGIVVGGVAALAFLLAGAWLLRRRRKNRGAEESPASQPSGIVENQLEYPADPKKGSISNGGTNASYRNSEMPADNLSYNVSRHTSELQGSVSSSPQIRYEVPG